MTAVNQLNHSHHTAHTKYGVYYIFMNGHIIILDERVNIDTVEYGHLYTVYKIGDEYWTGYATNTLDVLEEYKKQQLTLF